MHNMKTAIRHIVEGHDQIIEKWLSAEIIVKDFSRYVDLDYFSRIFASEIFDYFMSCLDGEAPQHECSIVGKFSKEIYGKDIPMPVIYDLCSAFRHAIMLFLIQKKDLSAEVFEKVTQVIDANISEVMNYFYQKMEIISQINEQNKTLRHFSDVTDEFLVVSRTNPKGIITYVNDNFCKLSGYSREELIGKPHNIIRHPSVKPEFFENLWRTIKEGGIWHQKLLNMGKSGKEFYVDTMVFPEVDTYGEVQEYVSIRTDLTDLYDMQEDLKKDQSDLSRQIQKQNQQLMEERELFKQGPTIVFKCKNEPYWPIEYISDNVKDILGYSKEELEAGALTFSDILFDFDKKKVLEEIDTLEHQESGYFRHQPFRLVTKNGEVVWIDASNTVIKNEAGEVTHFYGYIQDVSQLIESKARFQNLVDNIGKSFVFYSHDPFNGNLFFITEAARTIFGLDPVHTIGTPWMDAVQWTRESTSRGSKSIEDLLSGQKELVNMELSFIHPEGDERFVKVTSFAVRDAANKAISIDGIVEDATELKKAELENQKNQIILDISQEVAHIGSWALDMQTGKLNWSKEVYRIFEMDPEQGPPSYERFMGRIHPDDRNAVDFAFSEAIETKTNYDIEHRLLMEDGSIKYVHETGRTFYNEKGNAIETIGSTHDRTERRKVEEQLAESETFLRNIMETAVDGIVTISEEGLIQTFNMAAEKLFGYSQEEIVGQKVTVLLADTTGDGNINAFESDIVANVDKSIEMLAVDKNKEEFPIALNVGEVDFANHKVYTALIQDIRMRKETEKVMIEAKEAAEAAARTKSDFLANMSHEIRTPMNAIIGMSHLALQTDLDSKQRNYIAKVNRSAEMLLGIINDILDVSKIESNKLEIESVDFILSRVLKDLDNVISVKTREKEIELMYRIEDDVTEYLVGDPLRLGQILLNLVSNAVKFTPPHGEVTLNIGVEDQKEKEVVLHFSIKDTGIGMSQEKQSKLFKAFSQGDTSTTRKYGGTGLGLVICKNLVEMMHGRIWIESEEGLGSTFHFTIRLGKQDHAIEDKRGLSLLGHLKILLVDDSKTTRQIVHLMLKNFGFIVKEASSASEAISYIEQELEHPFDIVISDWKMENMDGLEMVRQIQNIQLEKQPDVIMMTSASKESIMQASKDLTIKEYLTKPIDYSSMMDAISGVAHKDAMNQPTLVEHEDEDIQALMASLQGIHILLVEDNEFNRELAVDLLTAQGISVVTAHDGQEALNRLKYESFDGILMDCQMPVMDGYEATKKIRQQVAYKTLPILALTANVMSEEREKAVESGMNDLISKPINPVKMFRMISEWIKPSGLATQTNTIQIKEHTMNQNIPTIVGIDTEKGLYTTQNDEKLYLKVLMKFKDNQRNFKELFTEAVNAADNEAMTRIAHTLKGVAASIGAIDLSTRAAELEQACKDHSEAGVITKIFETVLELLTPIIGALDEFDGKSDIIITDGELDKDGLVSLLEKLLGLVEEYDTDSLEVIEQVRGLGGIAVYQEQLERLTHSLENYDYENAEELVKEFIAKIKGA